MAVKTDEIINNIYILQSRNVRKLLKVKTSLLRDINRNSKLNNISDVEIKTKMYSLLYSAWSEAQFVQILHTPKALYPRDIQDIEAEKDMNGVINGWKLLITLAIDKVGDVNKSKDLLTRKETIINIITNHIEKQSILRNKIAHGQWVHALNRKHTKESFDFTSDLHNLDYVKIDILFKIHKFLGLIMRDLVQSPKKGFHINYWTNITKLENYIKKTESWSIETRKEEFPDYSR